MKIAPVIKAVEFRPQNPAPHLEKIAAGSWKKGAVPELWDGQIFERIVRTLLDIYNPKL